VKIDRT